MPTISVNGTAYDHNSIEVKIALIGGAGFAYPMIKSINFKGKRELGKARGTGPFVRQTTLGTWDGEGDMELYEGDPALPDEAGALQLRANLGQRFLRAKLNITITRGGDGLPVTVDVLEAVELMGDEAGSSEGNEPVTSKFPFFIRKPITRNGIVQM